MNVKIMMNDLIEEEISKFEQSGYKVRMKTLTKKRVLYTLIFGAIFAVFMAIPSFSLAFVDMVLYFVFMYNTNNVSVITDLAKKSPDTPISDIIKGEMK